MDISQSITRRRTHTPEFKQGLVALCQTGISISGVALAHGVNANLLRRWITQYSAANSLPAMKTPAKLVPVQVESPVVSQADDAIEINIQKRSAQINIRWPANRAHAFGQWLSVWLK